MTSKPRNRRKPGIPRNSIKELSVARVVLVLALPEERDYFHATISKRPGWYAPSVRDRFLCTYTNADGYSIEVTVQTLSGMGHIEAVIGTSSVITAKRPNLVIMVGIAGSLNPSKVGLGDVVVSNQAKLFASDKVAQVPVESEKPEYIFGTSRDLERARADGQCVIDERDRFFTSSFLRYERNFVQSLEIEEKLSEIEDPIGKSNLQVLNSSSLPPRFQELPSSKRSREVHFGWILGSNHVVDSREYREYLNQKNTELDLDIHRQKGDYSRVLWKPGDLLAVDMESYGVLRAVEKARTTNNLDGGVPSLLGGVIVRGISDICEYKGDLDKKTGNSIRRLAVENATEVALSIIEILDFLDIADV
jgi:nucleoside phosphorylase